MEGKKSYLGLFVLGIFLLFSLTFVSAQPPVTTVQEFPEGYVIEESLHQYLKLDQDYQYNFFVFNASNGIAITNETINCTFFLANSSGEVIFVEEVGYSDMYWSVNINGSNFSEIDYYPYGVLCQDDYGGALAGIFEVTPNGNIIEQKDLFSRVFLIVFVIFLGFIVAGFKKGTDLEKWNDKLRSRYENRNYVKFVFGSLWYNILKNTYVLYYLLGLFLVTLLYDVGFIFNVESILGTLEILLSVYIWGLVLLGIVFLSHVQEWFVDLLKQLEDNSWGMGK